MELTAVERWGWEESGADSKGKVCVVGTRGDRGD